MAKRLLDGYRIGGDIIDRVNVEPVNGRSAVELVEPLVPQQNTVGHSPAVSPLGASELPSQAEESESSTVEAMPFPSGTNPLQAVAEWYERELACNPLPRTYLETRGLSDWTILRRLGAGYAAGTLSAVLSMSQRASLIEAGVIRSDGKEAMEGCVVIPLKDEDGQVVGFYGRSITNASTIKHRYLKGKYRGIVNREAVNTFRGEQLILTEGVEDAISLLHLGIGNVIPCYGVFGFTDEHLEALRSAGVKRAVVAFKANQAGRNGAQKVVENLQAKGIPVAMVEPPAGKDWNELLQSGPVAIEALKGLFEQAATITAPSAPDWTMEKEADRWILKRSGIIYRVMGVKERIGSTLRVSIRMEQGDKRFIDSVDLYSSRSRSTFKEAAATILSIDPQGVEQDLYRILERLEAEEAAKLNAPEEQVEELTPADIELGMGLLTDPALLDRVAQDMETMGYVGETLNKKLVYIAASSRKLSDPLSVVIVSQSAAGKSFLIDTVRRLIPPEDVVNLTSLSDQALNYFGDDGLNHKLLILGEAVHSEVVEHQIREMLSAKELSRLVVTKDERTGKMTSKLVRTKAVVSLMLSTTSHDMNPENASRSLFIHADESEAQTKRIHGEQNRKYSIDRWERDSTVVPQIIKRHVCAQRLLKPVNIVNPYETALDFPVMLMRSRRDNKQFNELVAAICYLRQYQKPAKTAATASGQMVEYIEVDETDLETARYLMREAVMRATYLELPVSMVTLYEAIRQLCRDLSAESGMPATEVSFEQSQLRKAVRWLGSESIKQYLRKLVHLEYLAVKAGGTRGKRMRYGLVADESLETLSGLVPEAAEPVIDGDSLV